VHGVFYPPGGITKLRSLHPLIHDQPNIERVQPWLKPCTREKGVGVPVGKAQGARWGSNRNGKLKYRGRGREKAKREKEVGD